MLYWCLSGIFQDLVHQLFICIRRLRNNKIMYDLNDLLFNRMFHQQHIWVNTALCKSNANVIWQILFFFLVNFRAKVRVKFRKISCEKFHCQTIFRAKFQGNIAGYFRRANKKPPKRNFGAPTNKLMSNEMKQQIIYGKVTEM